MYHYTLTNPNVNMSESERMPGYLKKSQVPPMLLLRSRMRKDAQGECFCRWYATSIPLMPAPSSRQS